ncbi:hypothetical protein [uncultured Agathobaculum sp.]|uniref:hypothetical protein n=1 Tax=uncultured Agathobaculum sp. TaxID=2048140 RepID=UPI0032091E2E
MKNGIKRLLIGVLIAVIVTSATAAYQASVQPVDSTQIATLDDLRAALPRNTRYYQQTLRLNQVVLREMTGDALPGDDGKDWSETVSYEAYDPAGRVIATFSDVGGRPMLSLREYDGAGNCVRGAMYLDGTLSTETTTVFDEEGREISSETRNGDEISTRSERTYEPQPDGTTHAVMTAYDEDGAVMEQDTHILDDKNRVIHSKIVFGDYSAVVEYAYDDQGRLIHSVLDNSYGDKRNTTFQYTDSADGSACTYEQYENGVLENRIEQQFDENGVCIYQQEYTADGVLASKTIREPLK